MRHMRANKIRSLLSIAFIFIIFLLKFTSASGAPQDNPIHLMPLPMHLIQEPGRLAIDNTFTISLNGVADPRLPAAITRLISRMQQKTGIPMILPPGIKRDAQKPALEIYCSGPGEKIQSPLADESYTLEVNNQSSRLTAPSPIGILRGLETFLQLINLDDNSFFIPCIKIEDHPRFCWRGLHIDVSRHWMPPEIILRNLDAMAAMKMNVLHWHLSDDQGFRVESRAFPKLHQLGSEGNYYTQSQINEIVTYARDRGIRVIPEFDMPGHSTALLAAYPELASAPGPFSIERAWGVFEPTMDPSNKKLYSFLDSFIGEMARLFPDEYFHIGGDEVNGKQWTASSKIREFKIRYHLKDNRDLQAYFNQRLLKILTKHGGWLDGMKSFIRICRRTSLCSHGADRSRWKTSHARDSRQFFRVVIIWTTCSRLLFIMKRIP
jgi:hexosaminidase